jgi:hypothetical protein
VSQVAKARAAPADPEPQQQAAGPQLLDNPVVILVLLIAVIAAGIAGGAGFGGTR